MTYKLKDEADQYGVLWLADRAFDAAPTLSMFSEHARRKLAGYVQRALTETVDGKFQLNANVKDTSDVYWLIYREFRGNVALSMLNETALTGLVKIATMALFNEVDE